MLTKRIDGKHYAKMLEGGAAALAARAEELNALNVFPVADGDTGTNMLCTMEGGLRAIREAAAPIGKTACDFSRGMLLAARGNSGVILSQIFAGIQEGLEDFESVDAYTLAEAFEKGITRSYAAVQNPTEGTILTVFRESVQYAKMHLPADAAVEDFLQLHIQQAHRSLEGTKELLSVLAEADVVDSGAAGYLSIAEGMYQALCGQSISYQPTKPNVPGCEQIDRFTSDDVMELGYCTEFLLRLTKSKVDPAQFRLQTILTALEELGGESVVAYQQEDIIKVHVHTCRPGAILEQMQRYGEFLTLKIENMHLGHSETPKPKQEKKKSFAVVTVASGEGMTALFERMGADQIVAGGQSANPSIEDFLNAFRLCRAEHILVLPNNKNIFLAASQAAKLYTEAAVTVLETKNIAQGYAALSVMNPGITDVESVIGSACRAAADVIDGEITCAVRDADIQGVHIAKGAYMALSGGRIVAVSDTPEEAVLQMLEESDTDLCEIITLFVGLGVSDDRRVALTEELKSRYTDSEVVVYDGGQTVYDYLVAVE